MLSAWQASEVTAGEATCASSCSDHAPSAGALAKADPAFVIREAGGREAGPTCPPEPWRRWNEARAAKPPCRAALVAARTLEARLQGRRRRSGVVQFAPANRRKCRAGLRCRLRHRKSSRPLLRGGSRPFVPQARLRHFVPWRSFLARGTSGAARLAPPDPQGSRQPSRTQVVTPPAFRRPHSPAIFPLHPFPHRDMLSGKDSLPHRETRCT
jgi:hypothetical protein